MQKSVSAKRAWYERLAKVFPNKLPVESFLREEKILLNNKSTYDFDIREIQGGLTRNTEKRLKTTEAFFVLSVGVFLMIERTAAPGSGILQTFVNDFLVADANTGTTKSPDPGAIVPEHLNVLWNGSLECRVENKVLFEGLDTRKFYAAPDTQRNAINYASGSIYQQGMSDLDPAIILQGSKSNQVRLEIPSFAGIKIESQKTEWETRAVFYASGFVIPDVSDADVKTALGQLAQMVRNS